MNRFDTVVRNINRLLILAAGVCLVGMIGLTCANILLRGMGLPISGAYELMGLMGAVLAAFALGYTQIKRGHISVNVLIDAVSEKKRRILTAANHAVCMIFFLLAAWNIFQKAVIIRNSGEVTETLRIIYHPFIYAVAVGTAVLALVFFLDLIKLFAAGEKKRP